MAVFSSGYSPQRWSPNMMPVTGTTPLKTIQPQFADTAEPLDLSWVDMPTFSKRKNPVSALSSPDYGAVSEHGVSLPAPDMIAPMVPSTPRMQPTISPYGIQNVGVQSYLPIADKRALASEEATEVKQGLSQWWPEVFPSYGTPVPNLLADPGKVGLLSGVGIAAAVGVACLLGGTAAAPALLLAVTGGVIGGLFSAFARKQKNGNLLDLMKRLPAHATQRDLLSDPAYQSDLNRRAMAAGNSGWGDLATVVLMNSLFNGSGSRRSGGGYCYRSRGFRR